MNTGQNIQKSVGFNRGEAQVQLDFLYLVKNIKSATGLVTENGQVGQYGQELSK